MDATQARQLYEQCLNTLYIERDLERMKDFYCDDVISHPLPPGMPSGLPGVRAMTQAWLESFSDLAYELENFTHEQGHVSARLVVSGRHTGPFMGIAPTGRRITIVDSPRYRFENGKIAELWYSPDIPGLMQQLG